MTWEKLLLHEDRLRPIWRFLISVLAVFFVYLLALSLLPSAPNTRAGGLMAESLFELLMLPGLLVVYRFLTNALDGQPFRSVGLGFYHRWKRELGIGLAVGASMMVFVGLFEWIFNDAELSFSIQTASNGIVAGSVSFLILFVAASNEELMFRGYPFQRLIESLRAPSAVVLSSIIFGLVHLRNPHHNWISTLNTSLVGVTLAIAYLRTRGLWLPIGIHFSWNFVQGFVLGFPVSGFVLPGSIAAARDRGPLWITGGRYGPEGGILATGVIVIATAYLASSRRIYISEEMQRYRVAEPVATASTFSHHGF